MEIKTLYCKKESDPQKRIEKQLPYKSGNFASKNQKVMQ